MAQSPLDQFNSQYNALEQQAAKKLKEKQAKDREDRKKAR